MVERVIATDEAVDFIEGIQNRHGSIMLYQSGGCCDGFTPMCYRVDDFTIGEADVLIGSIGETPFYMHKSQYEYWKNMQLIVDITSGHGPEFSLDSIEEKHFVVHFAPLEAES